MRRTPAAAESAEILSGTRTAVDPAAYEGKAQLVAFHEKLHAVLNSLGICFFVSISENPDLLNLEDFSDLIALATGWDIDADELMKIGKRIHTLERLFNGLHASFNRKDDYPCPRFFREPIKSGPFAGEVLDLQEFDRMLDQNYAIHGWNRQGMPELAVLQELGLLELLNHFPRNL